MKRRSFLKAAALALATPANAAWNQSVQTYTWDDNSFDNLILFGNSYTGQFGYALPGQFFTSYPFGWRQWITVDTKPFGVPAGAREIMIGGIAIITGAADLFLAYRRNAQSIVPDWTWYQQQLLNADPKTGTRSTFSDMIPLNADGTFQFTANAKNYPDNGQDLRPGDANAVGWNFKIKAWYR